MVIHLLLMLFSDIPFSVFPPFFSPTCAVYLDVVHSLFHNAFLKGEVAETPIILTFQPVCFEEWPAISCCYWSCLCHV